VKPGLPLLAVALAGCTMQAQKAPYSKTDVPEKDAGGFECSAEAAQYALGQKTSVELATTLMKKTGTKTLRWIAPDMIVTLDYRSDRLNIYYDDRMIITKVDCG
jgi:Peptidase inhibitor I78 family